MTCSVGFWTVMIGLLAGAGTEEEIDDGALVAPSFPPVAGEADTARSPRIWKCRAVRPGSPWAASRAASWRG